LAPVSGRIPLPASQEKAYAYVTAHVTVPEPMKTRLQLGASGPLRVWLDQREVFKGTAGTGEAQPDQAGVEVELRKGRMTLTIEVQYQGDNAAVYARFLDPDRKLSYDEPPARK